MRFEATQIGHQLAQRSGNLLDLRALRLRRRTQLHGLSAAVKKLDPDMVFDLLDTAGKGGLRQVPTLSSTAERTGLGNRKDVFQPFQPHGAP
jgi:hypothetical protein